MSRDLRLLLLNYCELRFEQITMQLGEFASLADRLQMQREVESARVAFLTFKEPPQ